MVGDPTGRTSAREIIAMEDLEQNVDGISTQLDRYLDFEGGKFGDNPAAMLLNNADWLLELKYIPFLRDIGRHFSVNEMLATETYRIRYETGGLNFVEFNYRLVQGYDFLHLYREESCVLQMGGSDQWSNILGGVDLIRRADGGEAWALVQPLITTPTGEKMGKTGAGLRVWLDPEMFSPYDYYQYWVNTEDTLVETYLKRFTYISNEEIDELVSVEGAALREAKRVLAFEATAMAHGIEEAEKAEAATKALFATDRHAVTASDDTLADSGDRPRRDRGDDARRRLRPRRARQGARRGPPPRPAGRPFGRRREGDRRRRPLRRCRRGARGAPPPRRKEALQAHRHRLATSLRARPGSTGHFGPVSGELGRLRH